MILWSTIVVKRRVSRNILRALKMENGNALLKSQNRWKRRIKGKGRSIIRPLVIAHSFRLCLFPFCFYFCLVDRVMFTEMHCCCPPSSETRMVLEKKLSFCSLVSDTPFNSGDPWIFRCTLDVLSRPSLNTIVRQLDHFLYELV